MRELGEPVFSAEAVELGIDWREPRNRNLVARVAFERPADRVFSQVK